MIMTVALHKQWNTQQLDFDNSFVQAKVKETVYVGMPPGFCDGNGAKQSVLKIRKSLYGLVQAPRTWYQHLKEKLLEIVFKKSEYEQCLFYGKNVVLLVYVDDVFLFSPSQDSITKTLEMLRIKDLNFTIE